VAARYRWLADAAARCRWLAGRAEMAGPAPAAHWFPTALKAAATKCAAAAARAHASAQPDRPKRERK